MMMWLLLLLSVLTSAKTLDLSELPKNIQKEVELRYPKVNQEGALRGQEIDQIIKFLMRTGEFEDVQIIQWKSQFAVKTVRVRKITQINFRGNRFLSESQLRKATQLDNAQTYDQRSVVDAATRIKNSYSDQGFLSAQVEATIKNLSPTEVELLISVDEGPSTKLKRVVFDSINPKLKERLNKETQRYYNQRITKGLFDRMSSELTSWLIDNNYYTAQFEQLKVEYNDKKTEATLHYRINDPYRYEVTFIGNTNYSDLRDDVDVPSISSSAANFVPEVVNRVKARYLVRGYARIKVEDDLSTNDKQLVKSLKVRIDEGPLIKINEMIFTGRFSRASEEYAEFLQSNSTELIADGYYSKEGLEAGFRSLIIDLQNRGYLQARIVSSSIRYNDKKDAVTVRVNLDEGPLTRIQSIEFKGTESVSDNQLLNILDLKPGSALKLNQLELGIGKIQQHYLEQGFLEMRYLRESKDIIEYKADNTLANLVIEIHEGPKIQVQSIVIEGTEPRRHYVILKEIEFGIGDTLTPDLIQESRIRVQSTGLFASVEISTLEKNTSISQRTIIIRVSDRNPGLYSLGGGFDTEFGGTVRLFSGVSYRSLGEKAHAISLRGEVKRLLRAEDDFYDNRVIGSYIYNYLFDTRMRGRFTVTRRQDRTIETDLYQETTTARLSLEQDLTSNLRFIFDIYRIEDAPIKSISTRNVEQDSKIRSVGPTIEYDLTDNPLNATKGSRTRFSLEYGDPALGDGAPAFYLAELQYSYYHPIAPKWVWANSATFGHVEHLAGDKISGDDKYVPYRQRGFYLGGQSTIRGFNANERFPTDTSLGIDAEDDFELEHWAQKVLVQTELRFPIYSPIGGALFYDGGIVRLSERQLNGAKNLNWCPGAANGKNCERPWRHSIGMALRYDFGVAAIYLGFGYKLDRQEITSTDDTEPQFEDQVAPFFSLGTF